jgi:rare lipoprotein A
MAALACLCLAGCAQAPQPVAHHSGKYKEHFAEGKYWGKASQRMFEDGQSIPRGGGQYLVGRPYHVGGRTYYPHEDEHYVATGMASWYGDAFHGRKTANGEIYDKRALSAASPTMPLPSYARVTNLGNGYSVIVRVNDRGPYAAGRVMDMSSRVADVLDFKRLGTAHVKVEYVGRAPIEGSDDDQLFSTLRTDGGPADIGGSTMTAQNSGSVGGLFGASAPPPPPAPQAEEERPALVAAVERPQRRIRHEEAAADPPPRRDSLQDDSQADEAPRRVSAPLPPTRPYDLGAKQASVFPTPPSRHGSGDRALYFADPPRPHDDPLARMLRRKAAQRDDE